MTIDYLILAGAIFVLLILSAFFSGSETALTRASLPRMHELARQGNRRAECQLRRAQTRDSITDSFASAFPDAMDAALLLYYAFWFLGNYYFNLYNKFASMEAGGFAGGMLVTISVAWVLRQPDITSAIIGASSAAQLAANVAATEFEWDDELEDLCENVWWTLPRRPVQEGYR